MNNRNKHKAWAYGASLLALMSVAATDAAAQSASTASAGSPAAAQQDSPGGSPTLQGSEPLPDGPQQQVPVPVADGPQPGGSDDAATVDEVVVTGFRASLQGAINLKKQESGVVDVIKAEDIADFPDNNLAESIQRIPGVAITRSAGEGRNITVRGLGPGSTRVRINGLEALTTTGASDADGGANRARSFDFNVFASELFNSIAVRKTASASVEEGSLGATVDLQTSRPFDFRDDQTFVVSGQYGYNDLSESYDPRFAILGSKKFFDDKLGALVSVAYSKRNVREEGFNTVRWAEGPSQNGFCSPVGVTPQNPGNNAAVGANAANCFAGDPRLPNTPAFAAAYAAASSPLNWHPRLPRFARLDYEQERLGVTGSLQWRPTSRTQVGFDALYAEYGSERSENYLEGIAFSRASGSPEFGKAFISVRDYQVDENGTLVYGVFDNMDIRIESRFDEITTYFGQYSLNASHEFSDRLRVNGLVGTSRSHFKNPIQTTITFDRANQDGWVYDARENPLSPSINWNFDVTNPANYTFTNATPTGTVRPSEIRLRPQFVLNTFDIASGDVEYDFNDAFTVRSGVTYKKYVNDGQEYRRNSEFNIPALPAGTTMADISTPLTGFGKNFDGDVPEGWVVPNFTAIANALNIYSNTGPFQLFGIENTSARGSFRTIEEESQAAYVQLDFDIENFFIPIRGDVGVRYVETTTNSSGYQFAGGVPVAVDVSNEYTNTLPALNLVGEITPDLLARFGAAKVIVRPSLGSLSPGGTVNVGSGNLTITAGNPFLLPQEANTYDVSLEWYPAESTLYAVGFFYKDFKSDTSSVRLSGPFNTFGLPDSLLEGTGRSPTDTAFYSTTINTGGGEPLKGFELNIQQSFEPLAERFGLPEWTGGFGALFNYTYVKGTSQFCIRQVAGNCAEFTENTPTGVSEKSYNATLYYENDKFSARVSAAYRDQYLTAVPSGNPGNLLGERRAYQDADFVPETTVIDFSASYSLTDDLKISFEGLNLTDEPNQVFNDTIAQRTWTNHHTGRQYYAGFRYSF